MKNIYELNKEEKNKLREEFNKLPYTKRINKPRFITLLTTILGCFLTGVTDGISEDTLNINLKTISNTIMDISILSLISFIILTIILEISFIRWMKIKHKIEY